MDGTSPRGSNSPQKQLKSQSPQVRWSRIIPDIARTIPEVSRMDGPFLHMHTDRAHIQMMSCSAHALKWHHPLLPLKKCTQTCTGFFLVWILRGKDCSLGCYTLFSRYPKWLQHGIHMIQNELSVVFCSQIVTPFFSFTLD